MGPYVRPPMDVIISIFLERNPHLSSLTEALQNIRLEKSDTDLKSILLDHTVLSKSVWDVTIPPIAYSTATQHYVPIVFRFDVRVLLQTARARSIGRTLLHWNETKYDSILEPIIGSDCEYYEICNKVENYPVELVTSIFEELQTKNFTKFTAENLEVENVDYEKLCSFKDEVYYPQAAKDLRGKWHFILNGHSQPFQGFVVERCKKNCPAGPFRTDYTLKCVQMHVYRRMVYLDIEKRSLAVNKFKIPSCCSCTLIN
nr:uncharacterized protein LOC113398306 [Vanessa tameamea]